MRVLSQLFLCFGTALAASGASENGPAVPLIDLGPWISGRSMDDAGSASSSLSPITNQQGRSFLSLTNEQKDVVDQVHQACHQVGFFMIKNHGFNQTVMKNAWKASKDFFAISEEEKLLHKTTNEAEYPYGYEQSESLAKGKQLVDGDKDQRIHLEQQQQQNGDDINATVLMQDLKETFAVGPDNPKSGMPVRRWIQSPNVPPDFQNAVEAYYEHMLSLSHTLLEIFALALDEDASYFQDKMDHHLSALRLAHYFPLKQPKGELHVVRAGAHTDYGALTVLAAQDKGLEVLLEGQWVPVPLVKDAFIINLGDLMQRWTNDKWISTMHRVAMPSTDALEQRYSIAFFVNVNGDAVIEPLQSCIDYDGGDSSSKYPPITAGEHLMAKHLTSMGETVDTAANTFSSTDEL
jgi:isopenicillin N synthase-like dioxygenase